MSISIRSTVAALVACVSMSAIGAGPSHGEHAHKAEIGQKAPDFTLTDTSGKEHKLSELTEQDKVVVLEWFNPDCPFVVRHYSKDFDTMNKLADKYRDQNVAWFRVNSAAPGKQGAGLEYNQGFFQKWNMRDPILLDETGKVGHAYGATNTPQIAVIDAGGTLVYWGAIDNDPRGSKADRVNYVDQALTAVLNGETVETAKTKAYGCGVKYAD